MLTGQINRFHDAGDVGDRPDRTHSASPSPKPWAAATDQLPVARAFAPAFATAMALPRIPDVEQDNGVALHMEGGERLCAFDLSGINLLVSVAYL